jgi:hypothetical protein
MVFSANHEFEAAPIPINISTNSEPATYRMEHLLHSAIAFANNVLPVPGGPTNNYLLVGFLLNKCIFPGSFKKKQFLQILLCFINPAISSNVMPVSGLIKSCW